jgi:uncharacterized membrane protein YphA (DoxX/SURF4 family)
MPHRWRRVRLLLAWLLALYLAQMYVSMGWVKFDPQGFWTAAFARWGYPAWFRVLVGVAEVAGGIGLLVPWTASYSGVLLGAVMLGAWATRAHDGKWIDVLWITTYLAGLAWVAFEYRSFAFLAGRRWHRSEPR